MTEVLSKKKTVVGIITCEGGFMHATDRHQQQRPENIFRCVGSSFKGGVNKDCGVKVLEPGWLFWVFFTLSLVFGKRTEVR